VNRSTTTSDARQPLRAAPLPTDSKTGFRPLRRIPAPEKPFRDGYDESMAPAEHRGMEQSWTFLTNHAHVLLVIDRDPDVRQRDIAEAVGVTIGAVQKIIVELERGGYLERERVGRRNHYRVNSGLPLRHPLEAGHTVGELLRTLEE